VHIITVYECIAYLASFFLVETGQALVSSVDKIIFVGSSGVGRMV